MKTLLTTLALALLFVSCSKDETSSTPVADNGTDQYAVTYMSMSPALITNSLSLGASPLTDLSSYGGNLGLYSFNATAGSELNMTVKNGASLADVYFISFYKFDKASKSMVQVGAKTLPKGTALPYTFKLLLN